MFKINFDGNNRNSFPINNRITFCNVCDYYIGITFLKNTKNYNKAYKITY